MERTRTDIAERKDKLETSKSKYSERTKAVGFFKEELVERLTLTKCGLMELINGFVERKTGRREGLEPILPAGEITSNKFEEIIVQFIGDVLS